MKHRIAKWAGLLLPVLFSAAPALAADYSFVADVRIDQDANKRIEAKVAPGSSKTLKIRPGYLLKIQVGPEQGNSADTSMQLVRMTGSDEQAISTYNYSGSASETRTATLYACTSGGMNSSGTFPRLSVKTPSCPT